MTQRHSQQFQMRITGSCWPRLCPAGTYRCDTSIAQSVPGASPHYHAYLIAALHEHRFASLHNKGGKRHGHLRGALSTYSASGQTVVPQQILSGLSQQAPKRAGLPTRIPVPTLASSA